MSSRDEIDQGNKLRLNQPNEYGGRQDFRMQNQDFRRGPSGPPDRYREDDDRHGKGDYRRFDDRGPLPPQRYRDDYRDPRGDFRGDYRGDYRGDMRNDYRGDSRGDYRDRDGTSGYRRGAGDEPTWDRRRVEPPVHAPRAPLNDPRDIEIDEAQARELARIEREQLEHRKKFEKDGHRVNDRNMYLDDGPYPGRRDRLRSDSGDRIDRGERRYSYDEIEDRRPPMNVSGIMSRSRNDDGKGTFEVDSGRNIESRDNRKLLFDPKTGKMTAPVEKSAHSEKQTRNKSSNMDAHQKESKENKASSSENVENWNRATTQPTSVLSRPKTDKDAEKERREKVDAEAAAQKTARAEERMKRGPRTKGVLYAYNAANEPEQVLSESEKAAKDLKRGEKKMPPVAIESSGTRGQQVSSSSSVPSVATQRTKPFINLAPPDIPAWGNPQNTYKTLGVVSKIQDNNVLNSNESSNGFMSDNGHQQKSQGMSSTGDELGSQRLAFNMLDENIDILTLAKEFRSMKHMNTNSQGVFNTFIPGVGLKTDVPAFQPSSQIQYNGNGAFDNESGQFYPQQGPPYDNYHGAGQYVNVNINSFAGDMKIADPSSSVQAIRGTQSDKKGTSSNKKNGSPVGPSGNSKTSKRPPKEKVPRGSPAKVKGPPVTAPGLSPPTIASTTTNSVSAPVEISTEKVSEPKAVKAPKGPKSKSVKSPKTPSEVMENSSSNVAQSPNEGSSDADKVVDGGKPVKKKVNKKPKVKPVKLKVAPPPLV